MLHNPFSAVNPYIFCMTQTDTDSHTHFLGPQTFWTPGTWAPGMQSLPDWDAVTWLFVKGGTLFAMFNYYAILHFWQQWTLSSRFKLLRYVMKSVVKYDFIINYKCIMVLGSVNPHGSWYLPFWVIGWLYLSPVFSACKGWWRHRETACCEAGTWSC